MSPRALRIAVTATVVAAATLGCVLLFRNPPAPSPMREAVARELTWRNDRMHLGDESEPFTGVLTEHYPGGERKARSAVAQGLLHGMSEGWYTNGVLQVREHFHQGISDGVRTKWFPDGRKLSESTIVKGQLAGVFRRWHPNGQLAEEVEMTNNLPHGRTRLYHPNGTLKTEARVQLGKIIEQQTWKNDGSPALTAAAPSP